MQYYQEGYQGLLGQWLAGDPMAQSVDRRRRGYCKASELWTRQVAFWVLIFFPTSPLPFPSKMAGVPARGQPLFLLGFSTQKKGIQGSGMGS